MATAVGTHEHTLSSAENPFPMQDHKCTPFRGRTHSGGVAMGVAMGVAGSVTGCAAGCVAGCVGV